jgi:hypothetical protein
LLILQWPADRSLHLPPINVKVQSSRTLSRHPVSVAQTDDGLVISLSDPSSQDTIATVVELTMEGKAIDIEPVEVATRP